MFQNGWKEGEQKHGFNIAVRPNRTMLKQMLTPFSWALSRIRSSCPFHAWSHFNVLFIGGVFEVNHCPSIHLSRVKIMRKI